MRWTGKVAPAAPCTGTLALAGDGDDVAHGRCSPKCGRRAEAGRAGARAGHDAMHEPYTRAMFAPRSIKHCRACGARPRTAMPADDNRDRATCTVCDDDPLREPAQRRRHAAGLAKTRCCCACATSSRGAASGRCRPASWSSARRPSRARCARPSRKPARASSSKGSVHAAQRRARRPGPPLLSRAHARPRLRPRPRDDRGAAVRRGRDAVGRDRVPHDRRTLEFFFADRRAGRFAFHAADIG